MKVVILFVVINSIVIYVIWWKSLSFSDVLNVKVFVYIVNLGLIFIRCNKYVYVISMCNFCCYDRF